MFLFYLQQSKIIKNRYMSQHSFVIYYRMVILELTLSHICILNNYAILWKTTNHQHVIYIIARRALPPPPYKQQRRNINMWGLRAVSQMATCTFTTWSGQYMHCIRCTIQSRWSLQITPWAHVSRCDYKGSIHNNYKGMCPNVLWGSIRNDLHSQWSWKQPCILCSYKLDSFCKVHEGRCHTVCKPKIV